MAKCCYSFNVMKLYRGGEMKPACHGFGSISGKHKVYPFGCLAYSMHYHMKVPNKDPSKKPTYRATRVEVEEKAIPMIYLGLAPYSKDAYSFLNPLNGRVTKSRDFKIWVDVFPMCNENYKKEAKVPKVIPNEWGEFVNSRKVKVKGKKPKALIPIYADHTLLPSGHSFSPAAGLMVYGRSYLDGSARLTTDEQVWIRVRSKDTTLPLTSEQLKDAELKMDSVDVITNTDDETQDLIRQACRPPWQVVE